MDHPTGENSIRLNFLHTSNMSIIDFLKLKISIIDSFYSLKIKNFTTLL